jgi:hypothetical protein
MTKQTDMGIRYIQTTMNMMACGKIIRDTEKECLKMQALERLEEYYMKMIRKSKSLKLFRSLL